MSKTNNYSGLFIKIPREQVEYFQTYLDSDWTYSDVISDATIKVNSSEIALVTIDNISITHVCLLLKKRSRVATRKYRVNFSTIYSLDKPVPFESIKSDLPAKYWTHLQKALKQQVSRITSNTWNGLVEYFSNKHSETYKAIDSLDKLRNIRSKTYSDPNAPIYAQEKDAINLALRFAGIGTAQLKEWMPSKDKDVPFLQGLSEVRLREDTMINYDWQIFGNWRPMTKDKVGSITFENNTHTDRITIMNVNRTPIEETLGVDLIYYNHKFKAYVLVQYKRMETEEIKNKKDKYSHDYELVYRPIDKSYKKEIKLMHDFEKNSIKKDDSSSIKDYRFNPQAFYLKLCPADEIDLNSDDMIKGMYFPLEYWDRLLSSPETTGPNGGKRITYNNRGRHFTNTLFISLVQSGWIGSREITTDEISSIINKTLVSGKAVVLANVEPIKDDSCPIATNDIEDS